MALVQSTRSLRAIIISRGHSHEKSHLTLSTQDRKFTDPVRSVLGWGSILIAFLLTSCGFNTIRGSGNVISEARNVSDFDRVVLGGSGQLVITQSGDEALTVDAEDNIMQYVTTEVRNGTLFLGIDSPSGTSIQTTQSIHYILDVDDLIGLKVSGSGSATSQSLETSRLELVVSGSGDVGIDSLTAETADINLSGSGEVELMGQVEEQVVDINGSADYNAEALGSDIASITIGGSGAATVWISDTLDASVAGSGSVNYYGNPVTDVSTSGSGRVTSLGER